MTIEEVRSASPAGVHRPEGKHRARPVRGKTRGPGAPAQHKEGTDMEPTAEDYATHDARTAAHLAALETAARRYSWPCPVPHRKCHRTIHGATVAELRANIAEHAALVHLEPCGNTGAPVHECDCNDPVCLAERVALEELPPPPV